MNHFYIRMQFADDSDDHSALEKFLDERNRNVVSDHAQYFVTIETDNEPVAVWEALLFRLLGPEDMLAVDQFAPFDGPITEAKIRANVKGGVLSTMEMVSRINGTH